MAGPAKKQSRPHAPRAQQPTAEPAHPFGSPGAPFSPSSPFVFGLFATLGALLALLIGVTVYNLASVLVLVAVALFLAVGLNPLVEWLIARGVPRSWSVLAVVVAALAALAAFLFALVPVITDQAGNLVQEAPAWLDKLQHLSWVEDLDAKYDVIDKLSSYITSGDLSQRVFGGVVGVGLKILGFLANAFLVTVMTLYFIAGLPTIKKTIYRFAPASRRERVSALGDQILDGIGGYVSGAFVVAMCAGISTLVFLFIVGLGKYALALSLVVALLDVIPMIGATIGAVIVCAIGFATDVQTGIFLAIFYIAYQQLENYVIYPRVMSKAVDLPGVLTVIAALVGASLLGVVGALMAIPTMAAVVLLVKEVVYRRQDAH